MTRQILTLWIDYLSLLVVGVVMVLNDTMRINNKTDTYFADRLLVSACCGCCNGPK